MADWVKKVRLIPPKQQLTLRLDKDVIDFFKDAGAGYQTVMNAVLRAYVDHHLVRRSLDDPNRGHTDWERVRSLTDEDIEKAIANDPDAAPITTDFSAAKIVRAGQR